MAIFIKDLVRCADCGIERGQHYGLRHYFVEPPEPEAFCSCEYPVFHICGEFCEVCSKRKRQPSPAEELQPTP